MFYPFLFSCSPLVISLITLSVFSKNKRKKKNSLFSCRPYLSMAYCKWIYAAESRMSVGQHNETKDD